LRLGWNYALVVLNFLIVEMVLMVRLMIFENLFNNKKLSIWITD
jgi:hypothetical protein